VADDLNLFIDLTKITFDKNKKSVVLNYHKWNKERRIEIQQNKEIRIFIR
jgi:hypothetical protein